jgi:putative Holliday junction resolvase
MRYLGIDYGNKRTGLAICDAAETMSTPLAVIQGQKNLLPKIQDVVETEEISGVVVGLPLSMDDSQSPQTKRVLSFVEQLKERLQVPVYLQDERLSSFGAEREIAGARLTIEKKKKWLDAIAAATILEAFLQAKKSR